MDWKHNDGGRAAAGYRGSTGDCVTRAIAIATELPYQQVYEALNAQAQGMRQTKHVRGSSARTGVARTVYDRYLKARGWKWTPTMLIGSGCKVHLADGELPAGRLIVRLSRHLTAVINGVIHDTHDPQRTTFFYEASGTRRAERCVYGYYSRAA